MDKKVLYLGNNETYNLFLDVAAQSSTTIVPVFAVDKTKNEIVNAAISQPYEMIILNVSEIVIASESIYDIIYAISSGTKTKFVVMAQGYSSKSTIVIESAKAGVKYFMLSTDAAGLKETYLNTLAGVKNVNDIVDVYSVRTNELLDNAQNMAQIPVSQRYNYTEIGVAGCIDRMGVTSVAIQLVKYFQYIGKTACYIDITNTDYISFCKDYYYCNAIDDDMHMINIDGIDIYTDITAETMKNIYIKNYDFMIYDIGNISENPQKQTSFLQKKFRLLVTGQKPNEIHEFNKLIDAMYNTNIAYLFNFVPKADREDVIEDTQNKGNAYFVPFYDDCFSLVSESIPMFNTIFESVIPKIEDSQPVLSKKELRQLKKEQKKAERQQRKQGKISEAENEN